MSRKPRDATYYNNPTFKCPILFLVEGLDEFEFLRFLRKRKDIQIHSYVGKDSLPIVLRDIQGVEGYSEIKYFVVFRDCDDNPTGALDSILQHVTNALKLKAKPKVQSKEWFKDNNGNDWCVMLVPDAESKGDLETLVWRAISQSCHTKCVDGLVDCLKTCDPIPIGAESKARLYSWLSTQKEPIRHLYAALDALFDPAHSSFEEICTFIDSIETVQS